MFNVSIPEISEEELKKRAKRIRPIVEIGGTKYFLRKFSMDELTGISYLWNADEDKRKQVDMSIYVPHEDMQCIHKYGYYGIFKPSIAEVLAQIPEMDVNFIDAFEIIEYPMSVADLNEENKIIFNNGFHISTVRLYISKYNPHVVFA